MLSERLLRERPAFVRAELAGRHADAETLAALDAWLALDAERRAAATAYDALASDQRRQRGQRQPPRQSTPAAPETVVYPDVGDQPITDTADSSAWDGSAPSAREDRRALDEGRRAVAAFEAQMRPLALRLPNLPDPRAPAGADASANVEVRRWGAPPALTVTLLDHATLGARLGLLDSVRATRLAGPRFPLLVGLGARLARALAALMLDLHRERGYVEIAPPHLLRAATLEGTGHLPQHQDDLFAIPRDGLYLSPTAEAQLVALHAGETLPERTLPLAYTAHTPAFRRESASANAQSHGLLRQRQFDKVEIVRITTPAEADTAFETLLADAEAVLLRLELPYRVVMLCAGELPFSAQRTYDLEVWMAGQPGDEPLQRGRYVEVASISDCGTFQARRLGLRYTPTDGGGARYPHTLNASALAIGRTLAALLEDYQRADGSVALPAALAPYLAERELR